MAEEKTFTQEEVQKLLDLQKEQLRQETVWFIAEKSTEIAEKKATNMALIMAEQYKELSIEEKLFEQDKKQLLFYIDDKALPADMTLWKMMMCRQLGRELGLSLIQTINWIAFVNWKPSLFWETYLSLITKNGYKINVLEETEESVEIELVWPNGTQKWKFTKKEAELAQIWKNVYLKYPKRMLRYKAIRNAQNILCPHITWGAYLTDEAEEVNIRWSRKEEFKNLAQEWTGFSIADIIPSSEEVVEWEVENTLPSNEEKVW